MSNPEQRKCGICREVRPLSEVTEFGRRVCEQCLPELTLRHIEKPVRQRRMIGRGELAAVAISGGKDSAVMFHALHALRRRLNFRLIAIHVDMGLGEYSARSREACERLARSLHVSLAVEEVASFGIQIERAAGWGICAVCGAVRRALLPRAARREGADVLCMGHTLEDNLQCILKNLLSGRAEAPQPVMPTIANMPRKAKPLFFVTERGTAAYAAAHDLPVVTQRCPHFPPETHRLKEVGEALERLAPNGKLQVLRTLTKHFRAREKRGTFHPCPSCGEPTTLESCPICRLRMYQGRDTATADAEISAEPADRRTSRGTESV